MQNGAIGPFNYGEGMSHLTLPLIGLPWYSYHNQSQSSCLTQPTKAMSESLSEAEQGRRSLYYTRKVSAQWLAMCFGETAL